ncbi:MAG: hypothetical protein C4519_23255 [Desulfobacteraceae bacterium]|nr:MAG: hypothetical protein C4519_23255 [Desulfobacteraceae bacterium]
MTVIFQEARGFIGVANPYDQFLIRNQFLHFQITPAECHGDLHKTQYLILLTIDHRLYDLIPLPGVEDALESGVAAFLGGFDQQTFSFGFAGRSELLFEIEVDSVIIMY